MTGRSGRSSQREKVRRALEIARKALGDAAKPNQPQATKYVGDTRPEPVHRSTESIGVWTLGEVAVKLQITRAEVERMIAAGRLTGLRAGWTVMVPSVEVERLLRQR